MFNIRCVEQEVDSTHNVLVMERNMVYDCYVMEHDDNTETPFLYMFGITPDNVHSFEDAVEIAVANAPDYYDLFEEESEPPKPSGDEAGFNATLNLFRALKDE